jgi:hypothetical protein
MQRWRLKPKVHESVNLLFQNAKPDLAFPEIRPQPELHTCDDAWSI